jgi:hypothetical protein
VSFSKITLLIISLASASVFKVIGFLYLSFLLALASFCCCRGGNTVLIC